MNNIRPSDVFLKSDLAAMLRALAVSAQVTASDGECLRCYLSALATVAVALSIPPADVVDVALIGRWE